MLTLSFIHPLSATIYCSPLWCPHLIMDIKSLETVQRRATRFIVSDASRNYSDRLLRLTMLPLMMEYEIAEIIFLVKSMKYPSNHFSITDFISFCATGTRSSSFLKLRHSMTKTNTQGHFYFNRIPRLWNSLPSFDTITCLSRLLSQNYDDFSESLNFDSNKVCT